MFREVLMPLVQISVPAGSFTLEQKTELVAKITDVVVEVAGIPTVRQGTWVHVNEVPDGGWGRAGLVSTLADFTARLGVS
jgi:4-oxalocrotonate tautomerase